MEKIDRGTLVLVKKLLNRLDIGVVEKKHQTAPLFEVRTILEKSSRRYQCNLIPLGRIPAGIKDIEDAVEKLCAYPQLDLIEKIKAGKKFDEAEIYLIQEIFSIDTNEEPIDF